MKFLKLVIILFFSMNSFISMLNAQVCSSDLNFDGIDDIVTIPNNALFFQSLNFTIEATVQNEALTGQRQLLGNMGMGAQDGVSLVFNNKLLQLRIFATTMNFDFVFTEEACTRISVVSDATNNEARLYVNGNFESSTINNLTLVGPMTNDLIIGGSVDPAIDDFNGNLDEIKIWNDVRTVNEISDNFDADLNGDEQGLVAYYKFDEDMGQTATDHSINGLHGYLGTLSSPDNGDPLWRNQAPLNGLCHVTEPDAGFVFVELACGGEFQFTSDQAPLGNQTHSWNFGDGSPIVNVANPTHQFTGNGPFQVSHTVIIQTCGVTTEIETVTPTVCPTICNKLIFDGIENFAKVGNFYNFGNTKNTGLTIDLEVKLNELDREQTLLYKGKKKNWIRLFVNDNNELVFSYGKSSPTNVINSGYALGDDNCYHITFERSVNNFNFYIDKDENPESSTYITGPASLFSADEFLRLGVDVDYNVIPSNDLDHPLNGEIHHVGVWNKDMITNNPLTAPLTIWDDNFDPSTDNVNLKGYWDFATSIPNGVSNPQQFDDLSPNTNYVTLGYSTTDEPTKDPTWSDHNCCNSGCITGINGNVLPLSQDICDGGWFDPISVTNQIGTVLRWEVMLSPNGDWFAWPNTNSTTSSNLASPALPYFEENETYKIRAVIDEGASCPNSFSEEATVIVFPVPNPPIVSRIPSSGAFACIGDPLTVNVSSSGSGGVGTCNLRYEYFTPSLGWQSSSTIPVIIAEAGINNIYTIRECTGLNCIIVQQHVWSLDGSCRTIGESSEPSNSENLESSPKFNVYPNPTKGRVFIELKEAINEKLTCSIINTLGEHVDYIIDGNATSKINLDISAFNKGYYFISIINTKREILYTQSIILM